MPIFNRARVSGHDDSAGEQKIKRFVHSPLSVEHNGINAAITENGKVVLSKPAGKDKDTNETLYDEIEIPASLVFKLAQLLKATRRIKYVNVQDVAASEQ
jgi:hypothetical protein